MADKEYSPEDAPDTTDLEEPSTEKDPGDEPKAPEPASEEPSHEAVGIGVVDDGGPAERGGGER